MALKPRADVTRIQNKGIIGPTKRTYTLQKFLKRSYALLQKQEAAPVSLLFQFIGGALVDYFNFICFLNINRCSAQDTASIRCTLTGTFVA